jgi:mevalonate kinase
MEQALGTLLSAGPLGILCAVLLIGLAGAVVAWRAAEARLLEKTEKSAEALAASTEVLRSSNETRDAMTEALREVSRLQTEIMGRVERALALSDQADRCAKDIKRMVGENQESLNRVGMETTRLERAVALLDARRGGA